MAAHIPVRTCVGCGRRRPAPELVRVALVEAGDGPVAVLGRAPGRGAWLCGAACVPAARRRRGFHRAWRVDVPERVLAELEQRLGGDGD